MAVPIAIAVVAAGVGTAEALSRKSTGRGVVENLSNIFNRAGNALEGKK
jgi:Flp pilus assembly pilin Flp